ncbi:hypothetical protein HQ865_04150 [Mucilaginibacter mali]|uniref:Uncharacterized protein n=1 Tax=Mucilaginibacter mali TaxID=2740462 RepID=A0A7D4TVZ3_9SPHI|nr:hypothetical protein [Mucilaginibacter mali]QKJ28977.1 hypothetical protein HQ865_04150 [Mucilaginibacter mali]
MKKYLLLLILPLIQLTARAQTTIGPVEKKITDNICNCLAKQDFSTITSKEKATEVFTNCLMENMDLLPALAEERKIDMTDQEAMRNVGIDIGKNLLKQKCESFLKLSMLMVKKENNGEPPTISASSTTGTFKRIDNKGFNYIVITDNSGNEKSFLWLKQFPGSEAFMATPVKATGKKLKITWQDMEVYLPQAKGYYNVKEITGIEIQ